MIFLSSLENVQNIPKFLMFSSKPQHYNCDKYKSLIFLSQSYNAISVIFFKNVFFCQKQPNILGYYIFYSYNIINPLRLPSSRPESSLNFNSDPPPHRQIQCVFVIGIIVHWLHPIVNFNVSFICIVNINVFYYTSSYSQY